MHRATSLHVSALSPGEYSTYVGYYRQLTPNDHNSDDALDYSCEVDTAILKDLLVKKISVPVSACNQVIKEVERDSRGKLSSGEIFAAFRLLSHTAQGSSKDSKEVLFVPTKPLLPSSFPKSYDARVSRRASAPARPPRPPPLIGASASSTADDSNPFRRRQASHGASPFTAATSSKPPPPLPPRKASLIDHPPTLPPRRAASISRTPATIASSASSSSTDRFIPTSTRSSDLIRQSLQAAEEARNSPRVGSTVHVLSKPGSPAKQPVKASSSKRRNELIAEVNQALQSAEGNERALRRKKFETAAEKYRAEEDVTLWSCTDVLADRGDVPEEDREYGMIILNQPITHRPTFVTAWNASRLHYCADGGANRLYDLLDPASREEYLPTMVKGDLDSLRSDVRSFYESKGVPVVQDKDEYSTDLMKCIQEIEKVEKDTSSRLKLLLIGGLSGRIDQTVHTLSLLHKMRRTRPQSFVLSGESLAWVLDQGSHVIDIDHDTMGQTCGILPVGVDKAMVKTGGLEWNLDWETSLDGDVSSSNHLVPANPLVYLSTDRPVLWCVEVRGHP